MTTAHPAPITAFVETRTPMAQHPQLTPAVENLLRELARRDKGDGVPVRYASRGRWYLAGPSSGPLFNTRTFPPLYDAGLALGWDEHDDDGPMRITDAGRALAANLEQQAAEQAEAKKNRAKPNPDSQTARRLLREIAKRDQPTPIYGDTRRRRVWHLDSHTGYSASVDTWSALTDAGRIRIDYSFAGGKTVSVTDDGNAYLAGRPNAFVNGVCTYGEDQGHGAGCILPAGHEPANRHVVTPGDAGDD